MGTNAEKRARQRQNREANAPVRATRSRAMISVVVVAVVGATALLVWQFGSSSQGGEAASDSSSTSETTLDPASPGPTACPPPGGAPERVDTFSGPPGVCIDPASTAYSATLNTTDGSFTIALDADAAPETVNNFVVLARYGYYDGVPFHRIVPGFVIQAGDGDGRPDGSNDLGYTIPDELPASAEAYTDYTVAMANSGPDTNGSQFFVVLPGGGARLAPDFSRFGEVTDGRDVVDAIGALGGPDQKPVRQVVIESVQISETPR